MYGSGSESNSRSLLSPSTKWVLETELGFSGLGVGDFTAEPPSTHDF